jgi:hypothetical protein
MLSQNGTDGLNSATVFLYQRATSAPSKPSGSLTYTFATGKLSGTLGNWTQTIPTGTNPCYIIQATAISTSATDTIAASEWSDVTKLIENGINGLNVATVFLYQRADSAPTKPSSALTYTFSTGKLSGTLGNWQQTIPDRTNPCWVTLATASANTATDSIAANEWTDVVKLSVNGTNGTPGTDGYNQATIFLYQRAASAPAKPSSAVTYTFSTGALSTTPSGWSRTIPASDGNPCWVTTATAYSNTTTDSIAASDWSAVVKLVENGDNFVWNMLQGTGDPIFEVGGGSYYYDHFILSSGGNGTGSIETITDSPVNELNKTFRITGNTNGSNRDYQQRNDDFSILGTSGQWIFSAYVRAIGSNCTAYIRVWNATTSSSAFAKTLAATTAWQRIEVPIKLTGTITDTSKLAMLFGIKGNGSIEYIAPKLERGTIATPWSPHQNDLKG